MFNAIKKSKSTAVSSAAAVLLACAAATAAPGSGSPAPEAGDGQQDDARSRLGIYPVNVIPSLQQQLDREGKTLLVGRITEAMEPQLEDRLHNSRKFRIIARRDLGRILEEQELNPLLDRETAPQEFQISGVDYLVVVAVDHFEDRTQTLRLEHSERILTRRFIEIGAVARLWNTETGELLETANWELGSEDEDIPTEMRRAVEDTQVRGDGEALNRLLRRMGHIIAQRISDRVVDVIYPAQVSQVMGRQVYINRGDGTDIRPGQVWTVYALGPEMFDPATNMSLGRVEMEINRVEIIRVEPLFSVGRIVEEENYGIEIGHVLRREKPAPKKRSHTD